MERADLLNEFVGDGCAGDFYARYSEADLEALLDYTLKLHEFFRWAMWQKGDWCGGIESEDLQEQAAALKLIELQTINEPCCEQCACLEAYGEEEFPVHCYRYVELSDAA